MFTTKGKTNYLYLAIILIVSVIVGAGIWWWQNSLIQKPVACTQEAKICPDGSYVGRTGPNCEFTQCPATNTDETANWQTYTNEEYGFEIKYPKDWHHDDSQPLTVSLFKIFERGDCSLSVSGIGRQDLDNYIIEYYGKNWPQKIENININGIPAKKIGNNYWIYRGEAGTIASFQITQRTTMPNNVYNQECANIFNQMLSTFRFLE